MTEKLQNQVNGSEWSWKNLNTVRLIAEGCCFVLWILIPFSYAGRLVQSVEQ